MRYRSTRSEEKISAPQALLQGLAKDGGLYVPEMLPVPFIEYNSLKDLSYKELASFVLKRFLTDIPENDLKKLTDAAYTGTFAAKEIVPVKRMTDAFSVAEMFYGRTCAFKDLALSLFPYLLVWAKAQENDGKQTLILTATSGDTGKAALEGFRNIPDINIMVFYPSDGVSPLQKDQMQKQSGNNVRVAGIDGNFDDAQSALKRIFMSGLRKEASEKGVLFSSANSINIGRLLPQIIYYVWIWLQLRKNHSIGENERFNVVVPTGNFGNILAGWMAKEIGVPVAFSAVDEGGNLLYFQRMEGTLLISTKVSQDKAYTACALKCPTCDLADVTKPGESLWSLHNSGDGRIICFGGGYPIKKDGKVIGAIGVSGGTAEEDMAVATYALEKMQGGKA